MKEQSKKKLKSLEYKSLGIQQYMISEQFSLKQIKLLYSLRSKCYPAKLNFKKMNKGDLKCTLLCSQEETQDHIFETCPAIRQKLDFSSSQLKYCLRLQTRVWEVYQVPRLFLLRNQTLRRSLFLLTPIYQVEPLQDRINHLE